jgi:hypothetical protein
MVTRAPLALLALVVLAACSGVSPQPAEPARGRGDSDIPNTALPSERASIFAPRERKPEGEIVPPAAPLEDDLRLITVRNLTDNTVALDRKALVVGADDVVRYTLVVTSPKGARNVSYEGIRCDPAEWKLYAIGRTDGSWSTPREPAWEPVRDSAYNAIRFTLAKDYFCDLNGAPMKDAKAIFARMRQQRALRDSRPD